LLDDGGDVRVAQRHIGAGGGGGDRARRDEQGLVRVFLLAGVGRLHDRGAVARVRGGGRAGAAAGQGRGQGDENGDRRLHRGTPYPTAVARTNGNDAPATSCRMPARRILE